MSKHVWLPILVEAAKTLRATVAKTKGNKQKEKHTFVCRMSAKKKKKTDTAVMKVACTAFGLWTLRRCLLFMLCSYGLKMLGNFKNGVKINA